MTSSPGAAASFLENSRRGLSPQNPASQTGFLAPNPQTALGCCPTYDRLASDLVVRGRFGATRPGGQVVGQFESAKATISSIDHT